MSEESNQQERSSQQRSPREAAEHSVHKIGGTSMADTDVLFSYDGEWGREDVRAQPRDLR
ncbi:MAG: hypothetical protein P8X52_02480 [Limibacillus sp.]